MRENYSPLLSPVLNILPLVLLHSPNDRPTSNPPRVAFAQNPYQAFATTVQAHEPNIDDLCGLLSMLVDSSSSHCAGILEGANKACLRIWSPKSRSMQTPIRKILNLEQLLSYTPPVLSKADRLILGVELASAVVQFHDTEWLPAAWDKTDILFLQQTDPPVYREIIQRPLVRPKWSTRKAM